MDILEAGNLRADSLDNRQWQGGQYLKVGENKKLKFIFFSGENNSMSISFDKKLVTL